MRWCSGLFITLLLVLDFTPARASDWDELRKDAAGITSIQADFVQTKSLKILAAPLISTGHFAAKAPGSVRWEYVTPVQVVTLVRPERVQRFTHTDSNGWVPDSTGSVQAMQIVMEKITGWLSGDFTDDGLFEAELQEGPPVTVILTPKDEAMARFLQRVEVVFSSVPGVVEIVRLHEGPSSTTTIKFEHAKLNEEIPEARFRDVE